MNHTPGRAVIEHFHGGVHLCIEVAYKQSTHPVYIATIYGPNPEADARHIVRAVNSHESLVKALERLVEVAGCSHYKGQAPNCSYCQAQAAIAKATQP